MAKHTNTEECLKCEEILQGADPDLVAWFKSERKRDPELHCSCSVRGKVEQQKAKAEGKSNADYGKSPHNYRPSMALDLFFIVKDTAAWILSRYKAIAARKPTWLTWGADWNDNGSTADEKFKDSPHFEKKNWKTKVHNYPNGNT